MDEFIISPRGKATFKTFSVQADNVEEAANIAARKLHKAQRGVRRTGVAKLSGMFQAYRYDRSKKASDNGTAEHSVGEPYHVMKA